MYSESEENKKNSFLLVATGIGFILGVMNISVAFTIDNKNICEKVVNFSVKEWMIVSGIFGILRFIFTSIWILMIKYKNSNKNSATAQQIVLLVLLTFLFGFAWNIVCYVLFFKGCLDELPDYALNWLYARMIIVFFFGGMSI